jgi:[protein-PII] uridylyltransferase
MNTALVAKHTLVELNQRLMAQFSEKVPIESLVKQRSQCVDLLLIEAWLEMIIFLSL